MSGDTTNPGAVAVTHPPVEQARTHLGVLMGRLLELILAENYDVRRGAVVVLSKLTGQDAADVIVQRYQSDNSQDYMTLALGNLPPEVATRVLMGALNDGAAETRLQAAQALSRLRHEGAIAVLIECLEEHLRPGAGGKKGDNTVLSEAALIVAVKVLGDIGTPICQALLRKFLTQEANPRIKATAIAAYTRLANERMLPTLQQLLKDSEPRVRANAIEAIQALNLKASVGILQPYLYDQHQRVRANAVKAIYRFGDFGVTDTIKEMLADADKKQRVSAVYAIGEAKLEPFLKQIIGFLNNADVDIRRNAVIALRKFGNAELGLHLIKILDDAESIVRLEAIRGLVALYRERGVQPLVTRLSRETDASLRAELVRCISDVGDNRVIGELARLLDDADEHVVAATITALHKLHPERPTPGMVASVRGRLQHPARIVRVSCMLSLWQWGEVQVLADLHRLIAGANHEDTMLGLYALGETFALVSRAGGEMLETFQKSLADVRRDQAQRLRQLETAAQAGEIKVLWDRGINHLAAKELAQAGAVFDAILALDPQHVGALAQVGDIEFKNNRMAQASARFRQILEIDGNHVKSLYALGMIAHRQNQYDEAGPLLRRAIQLYPKLANAYLVLADVLERQDNMTEACQVLGEFLKLNPGHAVVLVRLARFAYMRGLFDQARQHLLQAEAVGPLDPRAGLMLGYVLVAAGDAAGAVLRFHKALKQLGRDAELQAITAAAETHIPELF